MSTLRGVFKRGTAAVTALSLILGGSGEVLANGIVAGITAKSVSGSAAASAGAAAGVLVLAPTNLSFSTSLNGQSLPTVSLPPVNVSVQAPITEREIAEAMAAQGMATLEHYRNSEAAFSSYETSKNKFSARGGLEKASRDIKETRAQGRFAALEAGRLIFDNAKGQVRNGIPAVGKSLARWRNTIGLRASSARSESSDPTQVPSPKIVTAAVVFAPTAAFAGEQAPVQVSAFVAPLLSAFAHAVPVVPVAYAYLQYRRAAAAQNTAPEKKGFNTRFWEAAEASVGVVVPVIGSFIAAAVISDPILYPLAIAASWYFGTKAMVHLLAGVRSVIVGGWQASHDQKYRVGRDGQLHDVRGRKYGEDRYEAYAPGNVGPAARFWLRAFAAFAGLLWLTGTGLLGLLAYNLGLAVFYMLDDVIARRRGPPAEAAAVDSESAAHASRFTSR